MIFEKTGHREWCLEKRLVPAYDDELAWLIYTDKKS